MSSQYAGVDTFPVDFTVPATGDTESAAAFGVGLEALADRTQSVHQSRVAVASMAALRAINTTSLANGTVRLVKGQGLYTFDSGSSETEVEPWIIDPTTGPGRWILGVPHVTTRLLMVQGAVVKGVTSSNFLQANHGMDVDFQVPTTSNLHRPDGATQILEVNTAASSSKGYLFPITPQVIDGATLVSVRCRINPNPTHVALPALQPGFGVRRVARTLGVPAALKSTNNGFQYDAHTLFGDYNLPHDLTWTADQNNVIDLSQFTYDIVAFNEGGTSAMSNLYFVSFELTFSGRIPARAQAT